MTSFSLQNRFFSKETGSVKPARTKSTSVSVPASFDTILMDCIELQVRIGGLIMLYSILAPLPTASVPAARLFLIGTAEDNRHRCDRPFWCHIQYPGSIRRDGGMCCVRRLSGIAQTNSVIRDSRKDREKNAGLSIRHYVLWKLVHASLSFVLFILLLRRMPACVAAAAASAPVFSSGSVTTLPASSLRLEDTTS